MIRPSTGRRAGAGTVLGLCITTLAGAQSPPAAPPSGPAPVPSMVVERSLTRYEFEADGMARHRRQMTVRVNDAAAVSALSVLTVAYFASTQAVTLKALDVEKPDGRRISFAPTAAVEDVTLSGQFDERVFSDLHAKRLTVPALAPGDRLHSDIEIRTTQPLIPGQFWATYNILRPSEVREEILEVDAPASRAVHVHALEGTADPTITAAPGRQAWRWKMPPSTVPARAARAKDDDDAASGERVAVRISSFADWGELARWFGPVIARRAEPDAAITAKAHELVGTRTSEREKLDALFAFVSKEVRYVSLSFGMGRYEPRPAGVVLSTLYGDCKDKHVLLASLARAVGIDLVPALASAGGVALDEAVASPDQFDHVVSMRPAGPDRDDALWLDSTSGVLPPGALMATMRNTQVLLATAATTGLVRTPAALPFPSSNDVTITATMSREGKVTATVARELRGDPEFFMRQLLRTVPEARLPELATSGLLRSDGLRGTVTRAAAREGRAGGLHFEYDATYDVTMSQFGKDYAFWLSAPSMDLPRITDAVRAAAKPVTLGEPFASTVTTTMTLPAGLTGRPPLPMSVSRPFADYTSTYTVDGPVVSLTRKLVTRVREIPVDQFDAYSSLERASDADYRQRFALAPLAGVSDSVGTSADDLTAAGTKAYDAGDFTKAVELLTKATALAPAHRTAWNQLGRAHARLGARDQAVAAYERQIAVNAFDEYAYNNLGLVRWEQGRLDEATTLFRKQIEVHPLDKYAYQNLGRILVARKQPADAIEALERALTITADDSEAWMALGQARLAMDKDVLAVEAFDHVAALKPSAADWNNMAWALAERGVQLARAAEYVGHAIETTGAAIADAKPEALTGEHARAVLALPAYWDTLGWILVEQGQAAQGEPYLAAAWTLSHHAEIAEHLAAADEKLGRRAAALDRYADAAIAGRPSALAALERLTKGDAGGRMQAARDRSTEGRTIALGSGPGAPSATVNVVLDRKGMVTAAHIVGGNRGLASVVARTVGKALPLTIPDPRLTRMVWQGQAACGADTGCVLVLLPASAVRLDAR